MSMARKGPNPEMLPTLLQYSVTRPVSLNLWFNLVITLVSLIYVVLITIINIATVGYQPVSLTSTTFNLSYSLWYERLIPISSWRPQSRICSPSEIIIGEGKPYSFIYVMEAVSTNVTSFFPYVLSGYLDDGTDAPINALQYSGSPLANCYIESFSLLQSACFPVQDQVTFNSLPFRYELGHSTNSLVLGSM